MATLSLLTNVFTDRRGAGHRDRDVGASAGAGVALGPIAGGWLLEHFWRCSIFLLMVPIAVVVAVYQQTRRQGCPARTRLPMT